MRNNYVLSISVFSILILSFFVSASFACSKCPTPKIPPLPKPKPKPKPKPYCPYPCPYRPYPPEPKPKPCPCPCPPPPPKTPTASPKCPIDTLKLAACVDALSGLAHAAVGEEATRACCPVVAGLADADAALCLCTAIKAKLLSVNVLLPVALELLVDCGKHVPAAYQCPA